MKNGFSLGPWRIRPTENLIIKGRESKTVEPKVMSVLCYLAANRRVVSRQELFDHVWEDVIVSEESLTRCISLLRKVFDENPKNAKVLKTISGKGYMLTLAPKMYRRRKVDLAKTGMVTFLISILLILIVIRSEETSPADRFSSHSFTTYYGREIYPVFCPADERLAFSWDGGALNNWDIYIKKPGVSHPIRMTDHPDREQGSAWSPDGEQLAFIRNGASTSAIYTVSSDGGAPRKIIDRSITHQSTLSWSPDGKHLAYADASNGRISVRFVEVNSGKTKAITRPQETELLHYNPVFSESGKSLAYVAAKKEGRFGVFILELESGQKKELYENGEPIEGLTWAKNDEHLILGLNDVQGKGIYQVSVDQQEIRWLGFQGSYPSFSRHSQSIIVEKRSIEHDLWQAQINGSDRPQLSILSASSSKNDRIPSLNSTGSKMVFVSNRTGNEEVFVHDFSLNETEQISEINANHIEGVSWSPGDRFIAINDLFTNYGSNVYIYSASDLQMVQQISYGSNVVDLAWSNDGNHLFYSKFHHQDWQVYRYDLQTKDEEQLTIHGGHNVASILNNKIAYESTHTKDIWILDLSSMTEERVPLPEDWLNQALYRISRSGIYRTNHINRNIELQKYDFQSGKMQDIANFPDMRISDITVSEDGSRLIVTHQKRSDSDLVAYRPIVSYESEARIGR